MNEQKLRKFIFDTWQIPKSESHEHSRDVELLGKLIYEESAFPEKIDMDVVRWFAYIHDVKVGDDHADRAAMLIDNMRDSYLKELTDEQITKLKEACKGHEKKVLTDDETIQVCCDADRLEDDRTWSKKPHPIDFRTLNTDVAVILARFTYKSRISMAYMDADEKLIFEEGKYDKISDENRGWAIRYNVKMNNNISKKDLIFSPFAQFPMIEPWKKDAKVVHCKGDFPVLGICAYDVEDYENNNFLGPQNMKEVVLETEKEKRGVYKVLAYLLEYDKRNILAKKWGVDGEISVTRANIVYIDTVDSFFENYKTKIDEYLKQAGKQ